VQARQAGRRSAGALIAAGMGLVAAGGAGVAALLVQRVPAPLAPVAWGVAGLGMGLAYPVITLTVLRAAPPGGEGAASAAMQVCDTLGVALGTGLGGVAVSVAVRTGAGLRTGIGAADGLGLAAALLAVVGARRLGRPQAEVEPGLR
jgi:MFS family permease